MELKGRNLRRNKTGDDVKRFQQALRQLGLEIEGEDLRRFAISGRVIDRTSQRGLGSLRIEAWDKDWICLI